MGVSGMPSAIAFFPWLGLREALSIGPVRLMRYEAKELPGDQEGALQSDIDAVLGAYAHRPNLPVKDAVLLELGDWRTGMEVNEQQLAKLFHVSAILAFSALSSRRLFEYDGYVNTDGYRLVVQRFHSGEADQFAFNVRRRDGQSTHHWATDEFAFHQPTHVPSNVEVRLDQPVAEALLALDPEAPIFNAIEEFNAANTDSPDVPLRVEIVMLKTAFEWLLEIDESRAALVKAVSALFPAGLAGLTDSPLRRKWLELRKPSDGRVLQAWATDFCLLRNQSAHGSAGGPKLVWDARRHAVFCSIIFPLAVKLKLAKQGVADAGRQ